MTGSSGEPERDFIADYMQYTRETESPYIYHRWCAITMVSALLARNAWLPFGHSRIFPNIYTMMIGEPGTRKSSAIKFVCRKLLSASGYAHFSGDKGKQEKFLLDLSGQQQEDDLLPGQRSKRKVDEVTLNNLWGEDDAAATSEPREVFICADEFSVFSGTGEGEFYTLLGNFWDWDDEHRPFTHRLKSSASVSIYQPTVTILGGTTASKFAKIFPPDIMDDGFMSRMIIIKGFRSEREYPEPPEPAQEDKQNLIDQLKSFRDTPAIRERIEKTEEAKQLLAEIYHSWQELPDTRFASYSTRRHTQLLKLCIIVAAARFTTHITARIVIVANTYLAAAEAGMPEALGEFGKSRNSDIANKVMDVLNSAVKPQKITDLWRHVSKDLDKVTMLGDIMQGLQSAGRVQKVQGMGWLPKKEVKKQMLHVDWSLLTDEEKKELE